MKQLFSIGARLIFVCLMASGLQAATFTLPGDDDEITTGPFSGCSVDNGSVICDDDVDIDSGDEITLTQDVNLNINGDLTIGNNVVINSPGNFLLNITADDIDIGNDVIIYANLTTEEIDAGNDVTVIGNLIADEEIEFGDRANITGNLSAEDIEIGNDSTVTGDLTAENEIEIGDRIEFTGNANAEDIEIGNDATISGTLTAEDEIEIGDRVDFNGNMSAEDIEVGNDATITGNISADNDIEIGDRADIDGNLSADGNITLGNDSDVKGQCTADGGNYPEYCDDEPPPPSCNSEEHEPWFDSGWEFRKCFIIDHEKVADDLSGFPILVSIQDSDLAANTQANGEDIVITDTDSNQLAHEIESYDSADGTLRLWFRADSLSASEHTQFFLNYGNPSASDQQNPGQVWADDYVMVQHLQEEGGLDTALIDSTANENDGNVDGEAALFPAYEADGQINGARSFTGDTASGSGTRPSLTFPHDNSMTTLGTTLTAEAWARVEADQTLPNHNPILWKGSRIGWGANFLFRIAVRDNNGLTWGVTCGNSEAWFDAGSPVLDEWAHYALTFDGTVTRAYVNGVEVGSNNDCSGNSLNVTNDPVRSGYAQQEGNNETFLRGGADELRLSSVARSAGWLATQFNNQSDPATFHYFGDQAENPNFEPSKLLAIDDFESYAPGSIDTLDGGTGWGGAWTGVADRQSIMDVSSDPMLFVAANGERIVGGNRALVLNGNNDRSAERDLSGSYQGTPVYVSMLVRSRNIDYDANNRFAALWFNDDVFGNYPNLGLKTNEGNGNGPNDFFVRTRSNGEAYSTVGSNNDTYFLVARLSRSDGAESGPYDRYELWVDPNTLTDKPAFDVVADGQTINSTLDLLGFRTVNLEGDDRFEIDRLAVGTQWADVVSPEPPEAEACFRDTFNRDNLGGNWSVAASEPGDFGQPRLVDNRLRLTDASNNVATSATAIPTFPAANNKIVIEFDFYAYGGGGENGADGVAVVFSDANVPVSPGGFGGSLGYAQRNNIPGFAGGWLGIGLDPFGNFSNPNDSNKEGGPGRINHSVSVRGSGSGTDGYRYLDGTNDLRSSLDNTAVSTNENSPHRYRITIDHRFNNEARLIVERDVDPNGSGGFITLIDIGDVMAIAGQSDIPEDLILTLTGSTGGSTNIHEIGEVDLCAVIAEGLPDETISHFEFERNMENGLTCMPMAVTLRACMNDDCSTQFDDTLDVTLNPANGWAGGRTLTDITSPHSLVFAPNSAINYTFSIEGSTPSAQPLSTPKCFVGSIEVDCTMTFYNEGLLLADSSGQPLNRRHISGDILEDLLLRAVRRNEGEDPDWEENPTDTCVAIDAPIERPVEWSAITVNPNEPYDYDSTNQTGHDRLRINGEPIFTTPSGDQDFTPIEMTFDEEGEAPVNALRYDDAGELTIDAKTDIEFDLDGTSEIRTVSLINTGPYEFRPAQFEFDAITCDSDIGSGHTTSGNAANLPKFCRAGESFSVTIRALNSNDAVTRNFGQESTSYDLMLEDFELIAPIGGEKSELSGDITLASNAFTAGAATATLQWPEVGVIRLEASLGEYLSWAADGDDITGQSDWVGRFVPAFFAHSNVESTGHSLENRHVMGFTYVGQTFSYQDADWPYFTLEPHAMGTYPDNPINNYFGNFFKFDTDPGLSRSYSSTENDDRFSPTVTGNLTLEHAATSTEHAVLSISEDYFLFEKQVDPITSFSTTVVLQVPAPGTEDSRSEAALVDEDGVCFRDSDSTPCQPLEWNNLDTPELRDARLVLSSAQAPLYGPSESATDRPLRMEIAIQFWDGDRFVPMDDTTALPRTFDTLDPSLSSSLLGSPDDVTAGDFSILESPPVTGITGLDLTGSAPRLILSGVSQEDHQQGLRRTVEGTDIPSYLLHPWPHTTGGEDFSPPRAIASFGTYEGRPPVLFMLPMGR